MSTTLQKIYSFFIVIAILVSSIFLYKKNIAETPEDTLRNKIGNQSGVIISHSETPPTIATTSTNEILTPNKITESTNVVPPPASTIQPIEIDTQEVDTRTEAQKPNPCVSPIVYAIGEFDTRFNISKSYFRQTMSDAASLWNEASGKQLFEYSPEVGRNDLTVNLIYDQRQQSTDNGKLLADEIQNSKDAALKLQAEYEALKVTFEQQKNDYTQKVEAFNVRQKTYSDSVLSWNEKGGAPRPEYDALMTEKDALQKESDSIITDRTNLEKMLSDINAKIARYNEIVAFSNEKVNVNNNVAQKKFTEGNYSPSTNRINIYQFTDEIKLKRVIAHELGHALGLDHTKNKLSIMYPVNNATTTVLSKEDILALQNLCNNN